MTNKAPKTPKINRAKLRRDIEREFADDFIASGVEYSCTLEIIKYLRHKSLAKAQELLNQGINLSKSNYPFAFKGLMADMFEMGAAKLVHEHYYPSK
jgi:hypothetical protein